MQNRFWYLLSQKLNGAAIDSELDELDNLLAAYPEWRITADQLARYWEFPYQPEFSEEYYATHLKRMNQLGHDVGVLRPAEEEPQPEMPRAHKGWKWWIAGGIAASTAAVLLFTLVFSKKNASEILASKAAQVNEVATDRGHRSKLQLPDGTQVWLNADSKLEYKSSYGSRDREVTLSGEAYFDVVKNEALPFIIHTSKIRIKVTGTAFNVKAYPSEALTETSLIRGKVEVTINGRPDEKYVLKPNEKIVVRNEPEKQPAQSMGGDNTAVGQKQPQLPLIELGYLKFIENDSLTVETSWLYNRLVFEDESFEEIARKMERWYGVSISITDAKVAATRFTYQIKDETIAEALRNMRYAARFHYNINDKTITITR